MKKIHLHFSIGLFSLFAFYSFLQYQQKLGVESYSRNEKIDAATTTSTASIAVPTVLDIKAYDEKLMKLANNPPIVHATTTATSTLPVSTSTKKNLWPVKTVYPNAGALLPFNRIVAYYGNYYSKQMGVLGEYPEGIMLQKLSGEVKRWQKADPSTPVIPAIHYIATTAQLAPGKDGSYMLRMPFSQIDKSLDLAKKANGIVFLDIQVGLGSPIREAKLLEEYLKLPNVHFGVDPEFAMKNGAKPGSVVGTVDAREINEVAEYLAKLVRDNNLPPKILVIHRFTQKMVTNYQNIRPLPEVQIVMEMDGWGGKDLKRQTYKTVIYNEPVQFTGFKIFYKNDIKKASTTLFTPEELLKLRPIPSYIQYQ